MLDYTRAAGRKIWRDIKCISLGLNLTTLVFSIIYLLYVLVTGTGIFAVNLSLLILSFAYLGFFCFTLSYGTKKELDRKVKIAFRWSKRLIKLYNLGVVIYGFAAAKEHTTVGVLLTVFLIVCWILDLIAEIASYVFNSWWKLMYAGLEADIEKVTTPVTATKNFFKKLTGQEVEEKPAPSKRRVFLDKMVEEERVEKQNKKLEEAFLEQQKKQMREERRQAEKEERKAEKRAAKEAKKASKRVPAPTADEEIAPTNDN